MLKSPSDSHFEEVLSRFVNPFGCRNLNVLKCSTGKDFSHIKAFLNTGKQTKICIKTHIWVIYLTVGDVILLLLLYEFQGLLTIKLPIALSASAMINCWATSSKKICNSSLFIEWRVYFSINSTSFMRKSKIYNVINTIAIIIVVVIIIPAQHGGGI